MNIILITLVDSSPLFTKKLEIIDDGSVRTDDDLICPSIIKGVIITTIEAINNKLQEL